VRARRLRRSSPSEPAGRAVDATEPSASPLLDLQRTAGNAAVTTLVAGVVQRQAQAVPVTARPEATDRPLLKLGMDAPEVVDLRLDLNSAGAKPALPMGSFFDERVRTAVLAFQRSVGLVPDGDVGPKTWGALDFIARDRVPQRSERDEMTARLNAALRAKRNGDFVGAAAILRSLYKGGNIPPEVRPSFLFPLAECEHHLGNFEEATSLYLEVVAAPGVDDNDRRNASQRLREARLRQPPGKLETEISGERREALKQAGGPEATDRPLLKPGMDAPEVVDLRLELNLAGASPALSMGTVYDDSVLSAVLEFQRSAGLTADGHVGPKTWGALDFIARDRIPDRAQRDEMSARLNAGLAAKRAGDVEGAAAILRSLYSTGNIPPEVRPTFIRALAECEHLLGNFDEAIGLYEEFAAAPGLDDTDRRIVSQRLREARRGEPPGKLESTISDERRKEFEEAGRPEATDRPLLKPGMDAPEVVDLRLELNAAGANPAVPMGTFYDEQLRTAVLAFQRSAGLTPDGHVGPKTWGALDFIARDRVPERSERDEMSARLNAALSAKRSGDFVGAAALLRTLYGNPKLPPEVRLHFIFPLAECEHHLGNFDEATSLYHEFLAAPTIDDNDRRNASQRLREARLRQPPAKLETEISGERTQAFTALTP
jgi:peptidoglycan hydrolase-like protein with peptidoglycan-binding domain